LAEVVEKVDLDITMVELVVDMGTLSMSMSINGIESSSYWKYIIQ